MAVGGAGEGRPGGGGELARLSSPNLSTTSASSTPALTRRSPQSEMNAPLRVPLEVIERILFFALGGDGPLATPFTCPDRITPPLSTAHLLRVSKGITHLALLLYWRSVTILRSDDWVKLWDPTTGLFAGERGRARASWVREVSINMDPQARIPLDLARISAAYENVGLYEFGPDAREVLVKLMSAEEVYLPMLRHLCLFAHPALRSSPGERTSAGDEEWGLAAAESWEAGQEARWIDHSKTNGFFSDDSDDSNDTDDSDETDDSHVGGHRVYSEEERRVRWIAEDDDQDLRDSELDRVIGLSVERSSVIRRLLNLDSGGVSALATIRTLPNEDALNLLRGSGRRFGVRILVYRYTAGS